MALALIPDGALALGAGAALAVGAAAAVLGPLWRAADGVSNAAPRDDDEATWAAKAATTEGATAVDALREIEFDRATGKLSDADYATLRATYTRQALAELRERDGGAADGAPTAATATGSADDALVEATIRRFRAHAPGTCADCGPRPEPDAVFCSSCGRYLAGRCAHCGAACDRAGQRFCADCGHSLAA